MFRFSIGILALALGRFAELGASEDASAPTTPGAPDVTPVPIVDESSISATTATVEPTTEEEKEAEEADTTAEEADASADTSEEEDATTTADTSEDVDAVANADASEEADTIASADTSKEAGATATARRGIDAIAVRTLEAEAATTRAEPRLYTGKFPDLGIFPDEIDDNFISYLHFEETTSLQSAQVPRFEQGAWEYGDYRRIGKTPFAIPCAQACEDDDMCHHWNFNLVSRVCDLKKHDSTGGLNTIPMDWICGHASRHQLEGEL